MTEDAFLGIDNHLFTGIDAKRLDRLHCILSGINLTPLSPLGVRNGIKAAMAYPQHWDEPMAWYINDTTVWLSLPWRRSLERHQCGIIIQLDLEALDWNPRVMARRRGEMWFSCDQALTDSDWDTPVTHYASDARVALWKTTHLEFTCAVLEKLRHATLWKDERHVASIPRGWVDFLLQEEPTGSSVNIGQVITEEGDVRVLVRCRGKIFVIHNRQATAVRFDGIKVNPAVVDKDHYKVLVSLCEIDSYYTPPAFEVEEISL